MSIKLNDIADELFIMNKYTVDKLFSSDNAADVFALYGFYYKTAKWQKTDQIKANDKYVKLSLKWGIDRIKKAKEQLKELGLIKIIQRRKEGKVEGWYIQVEYLVSNTKSDKIIVENESNNTQKQQVENPTSGFQDTNALKQKIKCLKIKEEKHVAPTKYELDADEVSNHLSSKILSENKDAKVNTESWAKDIEKAMRIDGRTKEQLIACINWIYSTGKFWIPNILSGKKLREKYDQLSLQMSRPQNSYSNKTTNKRENFNNLVNEVFSDLEKEQETDFDFDGEIIE